MGTNYDAWLEQPYQDACKAEDEYFEASEAFINTDSYYDAYEKFLYDNPETSIEDWELTTDYERSVTAFWAKYAEPEPMPDDFPYRERW